MTPQIKAEAGSKPHRFLVSFDRQDIERRLGMPAGRYTSAGPLLAPILAALITAAFYGVLAVFPESLLSEMFTRNPAISGAIVLLGVWALMIVAIKGAKLRLQRRALSLEIVPTDTPGFVLTPASVEEVLVQVRRNVDDPDKILLTRRIYHSLSNLRNVGRISDVADVLRTQAENDEAQADSSYTVLRGFIWAIPVLGFIGTVLGLSLAMSSFGDVLEKAGQMDELRDALKEVVAGLAVAFETTLQGLVAALTVHLLMTRVRRKEEQFLDDCKEYCHRNVVGRLRLGRDD
jgi:biopolymer transport protein ExbB/TolQ